LLRQATGRSSSIFISTAWDDPTSVLIVVWRAVFRKPFWVWNDTPWRQKPRNPLKARLRAIYLRWMLKHADRVLGTGWPAMRELERMGARPERTVNFPYFVEPQRYRRAQRMNALRFLSCGRLESIKGFDIAIRALARVKEEKGCDFVYEIAGTGPELGRLTALAASLGISANVKLVGFLQPEDLARFYSDGGIFLHPAEFEPYGVVVLEAMATGLPVIASRATAAALDRIDDGQNGFLFDTGSVEDLAATVARVIERPDLDAISDAARRTAESWPLSRAVDIIRSLTADA